MSPFGLGIIISSSRGRGDVPWRSSYTSMYVSIWLSNHFSSYWTYYLVTNQTVRTGRDSNPRPPPWQGGILTNWTTYPKLILTHLKLHHPSHCSGWQSPRWVSLKKINRFFVPSMYIMSEVWLDLHHVSANFTRWLHFRIGVIIPDL